jgi:hypothetical protein
MPRRKQSAGIITRAAPNISLSEDQWRLIAAAIDKNRSVANDARLSDGRPLRAGFDFAICRLLGGAIADSGPSVKELHRELIKFFGVLFGLSRQARSLLDDAWPGGLLFEGARDAMAEIRETLGEIAAENELTTASAFFADLSWLLGYTGFPVTLPSKGYSNDVRACERYPLFRVARVSIRIAVELAQAHVPAAVSSLQKLQKLRPSVLVEKIRKAKKQHSMLPVEFPRSKLH